MTTAQFNHGTRVIDAGSTARPLEVADYSTIGLNFIDSTADNAAFPLDEPVLIFTHEADKVAKLGTTVGNEAVQMVNAIKAQGIEAALVVARVAHSVLTDPVAKAAEELTKFIGSAASSTGVHALSYAEGHVGRSVDIIVGGGRSAKRVSNAKNPYAAACESVSAKLKAIGVYDTGGPDSEASLAYRADFSSRYSYLVDPYVRVAQGASIVSMPASPWAAAMFVAKDKKKGGPYWSPSNQEVLGILGTSRPITYFDGEIDHEANLLNEAGIATFIPSRIVQGAAGQFSSNGRILWGNRTAAEDPIWQFVNVVRTRATIEKAIVNGFRPWALDENMTAQHVLSVMRSLQDLLDQLIAVGAILGGRVYWDRNVNTNLSMRAGKLRVEFDAEEVPPLEDLIFGSRRNEAYFDNLASDIQRRISVEFGGTIADYM
ncbi:phage tail sheath family protein [Shinella kummerowiae]|uniref:phage tail sheath family protein n=1 Tax=Shinella kummerowiae TaxID=417745 RepID=UPI0021B4E8FA|nr:phage tail sheath subtilisin-like domain-containing protein [Shinella kummerowiae]MCT7668157.1 phage tail sheath subtilisin-like domain-containing protein [Shinella kummerowiae]